MNVWCSSLVHRPEERARDGGREAGRQGRKEGGERYKWWGLFILIRLVCDIFK
jgi:hypothetical protein